MIIIKEIADMIQRRVRFKEEADDWSNTGNPDGIELIMQVLRKGLWSEWRLKDGAGRVSIRLRVWSLVWEGLISGQDYW